MNTVFGELCSHTHRTIVTVTSGVGMGLADEIVCFLLMMLLLFLQIYFKTLRTMEQ